MYGFVYIYTGKSNGVEGMVKQSSMFDDIISEWRLLQ